jgi:MFS transporter, SHS family, lactate transporter
LAFAAELKNLTPTQRKVVVASFLGWTLDAFDFFILVFVLKDVAKEFGTDVKSVAFAIMLTLAMRPLGALLFGLAADRFGRRPVLMLDVLLYSALEFATAFAPSLTALLILRALFGIAMGGEWGVAASLTMESIPQSSRGVVSGVLQAGYPTGYLIASIVFFALYPMVGWRGMFMIGAVPALLVLYIRRNVEESPAFLKPRPAAVGNEMIGAIRGNVGLFVWAVILMTAFNFLSHGTQDLYPTFLEAQRSLPNHTVGAIAIIYNIGAIIGGLTFGALSERIGRRHAIATAAAIALPVIPLWLYAASPVWLAIGAFLIQFAIQGAWGVVPVHLNELSPDAVRGTFPGFTYQLGNLLASANATMQAGIAEHYEGDYAFALAVVVAPVAVALVLLVLFGPEAKGIQFGRFADLDHLGPPSEQPPDRGVGGSC